MPFSPGQSGNPGGRPKEDGEVRRLAREYCREAIERLVQWMRQGDNPKASVSACQVILDRGFGRPAQAVELRGEDGLPLGMAVIFHEPGRLPEDRIPAEARLPLPS